MSLRTVVLIRHAQSEHHVKRLSGGWTDTPLTDLGHRQAELVARRLKRELGETPVRLYTSDLIRTWQTAEHIAAELGVAPVADARLREFNNGAAAGLTLEEALRAYPEAEGPWPADHRQWPGGETWREFHRRTGGFLDDLSLDGPVPIVVTHGGNVHSLSARWLGVDEERISSTGFAAHVTGITVLQSDELGHRRVERANDMAHLAGIEGHISLWAALG